MYYVNNSPKEGTPQLRVQPRSVNRVRQLRVPLTAYSRRQEISKNSNISLGKGRVSFRTIGQNLSTKAVINDDLQA